MTLFDLETSAVNELAAQKVALEPAKTGMHVGLHILTEALVQYAMKYAEVADVFGEDFEVGPRGRNIGVQLVGIDGKFTLGIQIESNGETNLVIKTYRNDVPGTGGEHHPLPNFKYPITPPLPGLQ